MPEPTRTPESAPQDDADTQQYLDMVRSVNHEWRELEEAGDSSVQLSATVLSSLKESVRADVRRGAHVQMPPTPAGDYTMSELAVRTLVRRAVDSVPGALSLRTTVEYAETRGAVLTRGLPTRIRCRISVPLDCPDFRQLAESVREAVAAACSDHLRLTSIPIDIHIEDLHEY
ncbi:hypothetical protein F7P69_05245 [Cellulosimicrobium funkei]|nr:hypothetical protein [Cellulosimicrobium funkei]